MVYTYVWNITVAHINTFSINNAVVRRGYENQHRSAVW